MDEAIKAFCERGMTVMFEEIAINRSNIISVGKAMNKIKRSSKLVLLVSGVNVLAITRLCRENQSMRARISQLEMQVGDLETTKG